MHPLEKTIIFTSSAFDFTSDLPNLDNFGNKLYGKDVAQYLQKKLFEQGFEAGVVEEDWGWAVSGELKNDFKFEIGIYNQTEDTEQQENSNCKWHLSIQAYTTKGILGFFEKLVPVEVPDILDISVKFAIAQLKPESLKEMVCELVSEYLTELQLKEIEKYMRLLIRTQHSREEAIEIATDALINDLPNPIIKCLEKANKEIHKRNSSTEQNGQECICFYASYIADLYEKELANCILEETTWPDITDCDRLKVAFEKLDKKGILVKENFACCLSCGNGEILDHIKEHHYGATFYHMQDTENAQDMEDGPTGIYLAYGRTGLSSPFSTKEIAEQIIEGIEAEGLKVEWDRNEKTRIFVHMQDWKRRLSNKFL